ncbi:capsule assembly Wzi family protein [Pseudoalteromonas atlantica]|uniref:capsule assembly Wzi family protein n=1 Tax=Pseudoalteromonas atlantica TaxID=288 RepID=UPI003735EBA0
MEFRFIKAAVVACFLGGTFPAVASPTAYLPIGMDAQLDHQLDTLFALTSGTPMAKPYRLTEVEAALSKLQATQPALVSAIRAKIKPYQGTDNITRVGVKLTVDGDKTVKLANQRGVSSDEWGQGFFEGIWRPNDYMLMQIGADYRAKQNKFTNYNSFISFAGDALQLNIGYKEHWFSPFKQSAQIISTNARTSPSISLGMVAPAQNWWNFDFELYYSELEHVEKAILYQGELHDGTPKLAGTHISIEPVNGWKIGLNRMMQFGGGPREVSAGDVFKAFFDPAGNDNAAMVEGGRDNELGDQYVTITSNINFNWGIPTEFYFEYGGEDTKNHKNYQFGNTVANVGLFLPQLTKKLSFRYEYTNMHSLWYVNEVYPVYGNTKGGFSTGHFAADQRYLDQHSGGSERVYADAPPTQVHSVELVYNDNHSSFWRAKLTSIENKSNYLNEFGQTTANYEQAIELQISNNRKWQEYNIETTLTYGEDVFGDDYAWLSVSLFW